MRADPRFASIPVVMFTTSDDAADSGRLCKRRERLRREAETFDEVVCVGDLCRYWLSETDAYWMETKC